MFEHKAVIITISDKASRGEREDVSGPGLSSALKSAGIEVIDTDVVPDEVDLIAGKLIHYADSGKVGLILTTGGTGLSPRDVTPEATAKVIERPVPGLAEAMRQAGLKHTPHAMLSRGLTGIRGQCLIVNLPGSPKGSLENLETILPALPHGLDKLMGDPADCARQDEPNATAQEYIVPSAEELPRIIEELEFGWQEAYMALPTATNMESPQVKWVNTGYPFAMVNGVYDNNFSPAEMDQIIEQVSAEFEGQFLPFTWLVGPSSRPKDLGGRLVAKGFELEERLTCMHADLANLKEPEGWSLGVEVNKISNNDELREGVRIFTSSFNFAPEAVKAPYEAYAALGLEGENGWTHYLGRINGRPAAFCSLLIGNGVVALHNVTVSDDFRRKGAATAVTLAALLEAKSLGVKVGVLHATTMGRPLYPRLGFKEICTLECYVRNQG